MKLTKTLEALRDRGVSVEAIIDVVRLYEQELEELAAIKREKERNKKRKQRGLSLDVPRTVGDIQGHKGTEGDISSPSSPPLNGFSPNAPSRYIIPPLPIIPSSSPLPRLGRGSRLPDDWQPRVEDGTDELELAKFRDHWKAAPGQRGVKLDWDATWRNWLRRAAESKPKQQSRETPLETGLRIIKEMEDAEYQRSHASRDTFALSLQRQPIGQGDIPSPSGSQLRGLLGIDASITMPPKDWFDLEE